jgi:hypothetical protein
MWFPQWAGYDWKLAFSVSMIKLEDGAHVHAEIEVFSVREDRKASCVETRGKL